MTVSELIVKLLLYPPDAPVTVWGEAMANYPVTACDLVHYGNGDEVQIT